MLGKIEDERRRGQRRMRWLDGITTSIAKFEQALGLGDGQGSLVAADHGSQSQPQPSDGTELTDMYNWFSLLYRSTHLENSYIPFRSFNKDFFI